MEDVTQLSERLMDLVFRALDHATQSIADGGSLVPFVLAESAERERVFEPFDGGDVAAREHVHGLGLDTARVALAHDGEVTIAGRLSDAVVVHAQERGKTASVVFAQRYVAGSAERALQPTCNAAFLGVRAAVLSARSLVRCARGGPALVNCVS